MFAKPELKLKLQDGLERLPDAANWVANALPLLGDEGREAILALDVDNRPKAALDWVGKIPGVTMGEVGAMAVQLVMSNMKANWLVSVVKEAQSRLKIEKSVEQPSPFKFVPIAF